MCCVRIQREAVVLKQEYDACPLEDEEDDDYDDKTDTETELETQIETQTAQRNQGM